MDWLQNLEDISNILEFVKNNWLWLLVGGILGITLIVMLVKWILSKIILIVLRIIWLIISTPIVIMVKKPLLLILVIIILMVVLL